MAQRYLITTVTAALILAAIIAAACTLIDPYGIVPAAPKWIGFNATKVARTDTHRIFKFYDALAIQPQIVLFGSSRINKTMDPAFIERLTGKRTYNMATDGGPPNESLSLFRQLLDRKVPIERAVFELFYWRVIQRPDNPVAIREYRRLDDYMSMLFSASAIRDSFITVAANRHHVRAQYFLENGLFSPPDGYEFRGMEGGFGEWWQSTTEIPRITEQDIAPIGEIRSLCAAHSIRCQFIVTPIHPYRLVFNLVERGWPELARFKQLSVTAAGEVEDFAVYDPTSFHAFCAATTQWYDPGHFSRAYGERIVRSLFGGPADAQAAPRVTLTQQNLHAELSKLRAATTDWWAHNPDFGRRREDGSRSFACAK